MWKKFIQSRGRFSKKDLTFLIASVLIVLLVINFLASRHFFRIDLTQKDEFTLSRSTKDILKSLDDVVNINLYFTKKLPPAVLMFKTEVDDMLSEYRTYAGSKLNIQYFDPQESPQQEYLVQTMGIPPVQVNVIEKDKQEVAKLYLGIVVIHGDKKEVLPVVEGAGNLEYKLTSAILKVSRKDEPQIKWMTGKVEDHYKNIKKLLTKRYVVQDVPVDKLELDPTQDSLLVVPAEEDLPKTALSTIDDYLANGGKVFTLFDMIQVANNLQATKIERPNLVEWLKEKNIIVDDKLLLDRQNAYASFSGGYTTYHIPYPYWIRVNKDGFDPESSMVAGIETLILPWVAPLEIGDQKADGIEYTVIASTSLYNSVVPLDTPLMPEKIQGALATTPTEPRPVVVMAVGKNLNLLTIGNSVFIQDSFVQQFQPNTIFFENAVDYMAMGNELIGIRSKGMMDRPIKELTPGKLALIKYINILGAPLILVAIGLIVVFQKRRRATELKKVYCPR